VILRSNGSLGTSRQTPNALRAKGVQKEEEEEEEEEDDDDDDDDDLPNNEQMFVGLFNTSTV
jgi:ribosomal protein L12E/L44/L45/RPP1/RPP2